ncbi:hypothetical protein DPEC_G00361510 [Dallia pectoralis]|nr:hypothetical protein DPEC_G00361510 [Dallia pectoralis]
MNRATAAFHSINEQLLQHMTPGLRDSGARPLKDQQETVARVPAWPQFAQPVDATANHSIYTNLYTAPSRPSHTPIAYLPTPEFAGQEMTFSQKEYIFSQTMTRASQPHQPAMFKIDLRELIPFSDCSTLFIIDTMSVTATSKCLRKVPVKFTALTKPKRGSSRATRARFLKLAASGSRPSERLGSQIQREGSSTTCDLCTEIARLRCEGPTGSPRSHSRNVWIAMHVFRVNSPAPLRTTRLSEISRCCCDGLLDNLDILNLVTHDGQEPIFQELDCVSLRLETAQWTVHRDLWRNENSHRKRLLDSGVDITQLSNDVLIKRTRLNFGWIQSYVLEGLV